MPTLDLTVRPQHFTCDAELLGLPMLDGTCSYGQWLRWIEEAEDWQFLVVRAGGMATKSALDSWLVARHGLAPVEAHAVANAVETANRRVWRRSGDEIAWGLTTRPEPTCDQYGLDPADLALVGLRRPAAPALSCTI